MAEEGVVEGGEEGGDDHCRDAGVVKRPEEEVSAARVAVEEVGGRAEREADHGASQEHEPRPARNPCKRFA